MVLPSVLGVRSGGPLVALTAGCLGCIPWLLVGLVGTLLVVGWLIGE